MAIVRGEGCTDPRTGSNHGPARRSDLERDFVGDERFSAKYGERSWELESLTREKLREILEAQIRSLLDIALFEAEVAKEQNEQQELNAHWGRLGKTLTGAFNHQ